MSIVFRVLVRRRNLHATHELVPGGEGVGRDLIFGVVLALHRM